MTYHCCVTACRATTDNGALMYQLPMSREFPLERERCLKKLNLNECVPELLFICEKHFPIIQDEDEDEKEDKMDIKAECIEKKENDFEMDIDNALKTFVIYPTKQHEPEEKYEILANLEPLETSSHSDPKTEVLGPPEVEVPAPHCDIIITNNPFVTIELESDNESTDANNIPSPPDVPLNKDLQQKKAPIGRRKLNSKRERIQIQKKLIKDAVNSLRNTKDSPDRVPKENQTISVDSSDDDIQEIEESENPQIKEERDPQDTKNSEVLKLQEKLRTARRRVSQVNLDIYNMERNIKKIFNPDQIRRLKEGDRVVQKWSAKTLRKGLHLFFTCGESGYRCLLNQKYPLPSVNALKKIIDAKALSELTERYERPPSFRSNVKRIQNIINTLFNKQIQNKT